MNKAEKVSLIKIVLKLRTSRSAMVEKYYKYHYKLICKRYIFTPPNKKRVQRRKEKTETAEREIFKIRRYGNRDPRTHASHR